MRALVRDPTCNDRAVVQEYLQHGNLLPAENLIPILRQKIQKEKNNGHRRFLIDGFPRNLEQMNEFETQVRHLSMTNELSMNYMIDRKSLACHFLSVPQRHSATALLDQKAAGKASR